MERLVVAVASIIMLALALTAALWEAGVFNPAYAINRPIGWNPQGSETETLDISWINETIATVVEDNENETVILLRRPINMSLYGLIRTEYKEAWSRFPDWWEPIDTLTVLDEGWAMELLHYSNYSIGWRLENGRVAAPSVIDFYILMNKNDSFKMVAEQALYWLAKYLDENKYSPYIAGGADSYYVWKVIGNNTPTMIFTLDVAANRIKPRGRWFIMMVIIRYNPETNSLEGELKAWYGWKAWGDPARPLKIAEEISKETGKPVVVDVYQHEIGPGSWLAPSVMFRFEELLMETRGGFIYIQVHYVRCPGIGVDGTPNCLEVMSNIEAYKICAKELEKQTHMVLNNVTWRLWVYRSHPQLYNSFKEAIESGDKYAWEAMRAVPSGTWLVVDGNWTGSYGIVLAMVYGEKEEIEKHWWIFELYRGELDILYEWLRENCMPNQ